MIGESKDIRRTRAHIAKNLKMSLIIFWEKIGFFKSFSKNKRSSKESEFRVHFYIRNVFLPPREECGLDEFIKTCKVAVGKAGTCELL